MICAFGLSFRLTSSAIFLNDTRGYAINAQLVLVVPVLCNAGPP
jgi:hypothetical protein